MNDCMGPKNPDPTTIYQQSPYIHLHCCGQLWVKIWPEKAKLSEGTTNQQPENTRSCFLQITSKIPHKTEKTNTKPYL